MSEPSVGQRRDFFDQLYASAEAGGEAVPWNRSGEPQHLLADWAGSLVGAGRSAVVVGCGLGGDAEFLARLGFVTTGFDFSPPATGPWALGRADIDSFAGDGFTSPVRVEEPAGPNGGPRWRAEFSRDG